MVPFLINPFNIIHIARWHIGAAADDAVAEALHQIAACAATGEMPPFMRLPGAAGVDLANS